MKREEQVTLKKIHRTSAWLIVLAALFMLSGCYNGDEQAFREAVLINDLGITSIEVSAVDVEEDENVVIGIGVTQRFKAEAHTSSSETMIDISDRVRWSSSDSSVASITHAGVATGLSAEPEGSQVDIRAELGDFAASTELRVSAAALVSVAIFPKEASSEDVGMCSHGHQLIAKGTYADTFGPRTITHLVNWESSDDSVAKVEDGTGVVSTYKAQDEVKLTANYQGKTSNEFVMKVDANRLTTIAITPTTATTIAVGGSQQYVATGTYIDPATTLDITSTVEWRAANADDTATPIYLEFSEAEGKNGLALGKAEGEAEIVANCTDAVSSSTLTVTVDSPRTLEDISITYQNEVRETLRFKVGDSPETLEAKLIYSDDFTVVVTDNEFTHWRVKDVVTGTGAKVTNTDDSKGVVTFDAIGKTIIEVSYDKSPHDEDDVITIIVEE